MPTLPLATKPRHSPADLEPFLSGGARRIFSRKSVASLYSPPGALWKCSSEMRNEPCFTFPRVSPFRAAPFSPRQRSSHYDGGLNTLKVLPEARTPFPTPPAEEKNSPPFRPP